MNRTKIQWTERTWNPVTGCTKLSAGCLNCYAERMAMRLCAMGEKKYRNGFGVTLHPESLDEPMKLKDRIKYLKRVPARIKFLSCEPLLEDLGDMDLAGIDWVIAGGESGSNARPMKKEWVLNIMRQCEEQGVSFFFKQWGTWGEDGVRRSKKANGCLIDRRKWQEMPKTGNK